MRSMVLLAMLTLLIGCAPERADTEPAEPAVDSPAEAVAAEPSPPPCVSAPFRLCPVDEGESDATFAEFRRGLIDVVNRRDEAALVALLATDIRVSFGGDGGIDGFRDAWEISSPESPFWNELAAVLELGGSFIGSGEERSFWAPYVYSEWPESIDAFAHVAVIRSDGSLRSEPDDEAPVVASVPWEIVEVIPDDGHNPEPPWLEVRRTDGTSGWIRTSAVRSPIAYRAGFSRRTGGWKMEALVAGD